MNRPTLSPFSWVFGSAAILLASFLLAMYVGLLRDAVARGSQFKHLQHDAPAASAKIERRAGFETAR